MFGEDSHQQHCYIIIAEIKMVKSEVNIIGAKIIFELGSRLDPQNNPLVLILSIVLGAI